MAPVRWLVEAAEAGLRLDALVVRRGLAPSAASARRLLDETFARIDGAPAKKGARLLPGQTVELVPRLASIAAPNHPARPESALSAALVVLHVDDAIVVVDKPAGIPCHPLRAQERGTLADALLAGYPECADASLDPREAGFAHRLDTGTSGVLVAARNRDVFLRLRVLLASGSCDKRYLAEVVGMPRAPQEDVVAGAGATAGRLPGELVIDVGIGRRGRSGQGVALGRGRGLLPARTFIGVLQPRGLTTLVSARLSIGRTHQVRAHLAHAGSPILGDRIYGDAAAIDLASSRGITGFRLHAHQLRLTHPVTGEPVSFSAPPPAWARTSPQS